MNLASLSKKLCTYALTARYLKPTQVIYRLRAMARKRLWDNTDASRNAYLKLLNGERTANVLLFPHHHDVPINVQEIGEGTFEFLNRKVALGQPIDWSTKSAEQTVSKLWQYNLHYCHYAPAICRHAANGDESGDDTAFHIFKRITSDWIANCPVSPSLPWDAYPASLRIINWIKSYSLLSDQIQSDPEFARTLRQHIYMQSRYVEDHLEYDLLNNHLLENGRALFLASYFFNADENTNRWRRKGRRILDYGLENQIHDDGGHEELSPMYHQCMLDLYLEMVSILQQHGEPIPRLLTSRIDAMQTWLQAMCHPDGKIALMNDAAFEIAPHPDRSIQPSCAPAKDGLVVLPESGYATFRDTKNGHYLVFDAGPIGPDHQPGHGHSDNLGFELSIGGQRMIVDSGIEHYHEGAAWRHYYRSTRAHNTVVVDAAEQSEIWGQFRVARRAKPLPMKWDDSNAELLYVSGGHNGYQRLPGGVTHQRWVCWVAGRFWVICDRFTGSGSHQFESLLHFHPNAVVPEDPTKPITRNVEAESNLQSELQQDSRTSPQQILSTAHLHVLPFGIKHSAHCRGQTDPIQGWYAPEFGKRFANDVWTFSATTAPPLWCGFVLWPEANPCALQHTANADSCQLSIAADKQYEVTINDKGVSLQ